MFLPTARGSRGTLQIQSTGELVGIINRFLQWHFFQNVLKNCNMTVEFIHFPTLVILFFYGLLLH